MKKLIRKGVFETNSSSCHSISIAEGNELLDTLYPNKDGIVEIEGAEFGWEYEKYKDAGSKASYAMIYAIDWSRDKSEEFQQILKDVIKKQSGAVDVVFKRKDNDFYPYGYIDHQSVEDEDLHYMFEEPELLRRFIFDKNSVLITDNDNH